MMHQAQCDCKHHWAQKLIVVLLAISAIGFWLSTLMGSDLFGISSLHYFKEVVVFGLLGMGMRKGLCNCCCGGCANCDVRTTSNT